MYIMIRLDDINSTIKTGAEWMLRLDNCTCKIQNPDSDHVN